MTAEELESDFLQVCNFCLKDDNLINEFCRLKNIKRPDKLSSIEKQIDKACGYDAGMEFIRQFTDFVREFIFFQPENPWSLDHGMNGVTFIYCIIVYFLLKTLCDLVKIIV